MSDELKPCPFCGNDCIEAGCDPMWTAYCMVCNACGPTENARDKAIAAWNRRPTVAPATNPVFPKDAMLPCHSCGGTPVAHECGDFWQVQCEECDAATGKRRAIGDAIAAWNRRADTKEEAN